MSQDRDSGFDQREFELARPSTFTATGSRVDIHPAQVRGIWKNRRVAFQTVLLVIFLVTPWLHWDGKQLLLFDVANRSFNIFGLHLRAHNAPLFFFILAAAGFGLFFVTAIWGRVWCGWACPQTVFIERFYRVVERWIEGPPHIRRQLDAEPWSARKVRLRTFKWLAYLALSLILTHSFLSYFVGSVTLTQMVVSDPRENWTSFLFILFATGIILVDFGWFREQFCVIACPYGRFQSVLMDRNSLAVIYDGFRGEPRRGGAVAAIGATQANYESSWVIEADSPRAQREIKREKGDCVDCGRCVQVCPTGIDIRNGVQMECIACTACIDACDEVMTKVKKPVGLIRYETVNTMNGRPQENLRPRTVIYGSFVAAALLALVLLAALKDDVEVIFLRAKDSPYQTVELGPEKGMGVVNHFKVELSNQDSRDHQLNFDLSSELRDAGGELVMAQPEFLLKEGQITRADVFVRFPKGLLKSGQLKTKILVRSRASGRDTSEQGVTMEKEVLLVGPFS
jgi:cytochrome c oxidase accessory protein FixG